MLCSGGMGVVLAEGGSSVGCIGFVGGGWGGWVGGSVWLSGVCHGVVFTKERDLKRGSVERKCCLKKLTSI
jgi:hypothetical protein